MFTHVNEHIQSYTVSKLVSWDSIGLPQQHMILIMPYHPSWANL